MSPSSSTCTRTRSIFPALFPCASASRTSVSVVYFAPAGKKKAAASVAISQFSRNRIGHVTITSVSPAPPKIEQVPSGYSALSFVQFGILLKNGQSRLPRYRWAYADISSIRKPNTSDSGFLGIMRDSLPPAHAVALHGRTGGPEPSRSGRYTPVRRSFLRASRPTAYYASHSVR
jgi:hypothetical protein